MSPETNPGLELVKKVKLAGLVTADTVFGPLILHSMNKRIEGYPQRTRGRIRLWRARIGYTTHALIGIHMGVNYFMTGEIYLPLFISNSLALFSLVNLDSKRKLRRFFTGARFEHRRTVKEDPPDVSNLQS